MTVVPDIAAFLRQFPPFSELDPADVDRLAEAVEVEFHPSGEVIFSQGAQAVEFLRVIRAGAVEVVEGGRVLDLMGPGEMFGHASMLSGLPTGFEARAAEDTLTYRIASSVAANVLSDPRGLRYVTRLLLEDRHHLRGGPSPGEVRDRLRQPVRAALSAAALVVAPSTTLREAAAQMTELGVTALVVDLGDTVGIVTDADLRSRVVAQGRTGDDAVASVMTAPAFTVPSERPGSEVLLDMLDRGVRHFPVVSTTGEVLGVIEDHDLVNVENRSSFSLRRAVGRATRPEALVEVSKRLWPSLVEMHRGGLAALDVMSFFSVVTDALTRRALDLAAADAGPAPASFSWLALGSQARREALPSSDLDSAIAWLDEPGEDSIQIRSWLGRLATEVTDTLIACGFRPDEHRVSASDPLFVRPLSLWRRECHSLIDHPDQDKALVIVSVLVDSRPVWGVESQPLIAEIFEVALDRPKLLRLLAEFALSHKPPAGFKKGLVIDAIGQGRAGFDLKSGVVLPITDLARWAGMSAGVTNASTLSRLEAGRDSGILRDSDAQILGDAFELACQLRLEHQVNQLEAGDQLDDVVDPAELSPLVRSFLKEAFHAVSSVQRRLANEIPWAN